MTKAIRVALADDQALVRAGLRALLERLGDVEIAFESDDGTALVEQLATCPVDVVLSDIRMPGTDGID
ncbi:MAG TPA: response regulator, partial [Pseudoxanthomonas sp.]|nr:response regulator [Pseudoxanthomonas sp.]